MQYESDTKSQIIFEIDHLATHYYQLFQNRKMNNYNDEGRVYSRYFFMRIRVLANLLYS
jgi:hypothetical protein